MAGGAVDKKDLYEYSLPEPNTNKPQDQKIAIRAFRKFGFGGVGTFHTYVSQFPFRGHDQWTIDDGPANKQEVIKEMLSLTSNDLLQGHLSSQTASGQPDTSHRHADITDEIIEQNPFLFAMNQAKLNDIHK